MECIDIVFCGFPKNNIDYFVKKELNINKSKVVSSHFFSIEKGDYEYYDDISLIEYFKSCNTCNLFISDIYLGDIINNVVIIISSDEVDLEVTISIESELFNVYNKKKVICYLENIHFRYNIEKIIIINDNSNLDYDYKIE